MSSELLPTDPTDYVGEQYESEFSWNTKYFSWPGPLTDAVIVEISWDGGDAGAVAMWAVNGTLTSSTSAIGTVLILPRGTTGAVLVGRPSAAGKLARPLGVSLSGGTLPKWSCDGSRIYFFSPDGWIMESAVSRASGRISPATPVRVVPASGSDFIPASDGQRFLIMEAAPMRPIAVANWKGLLRRSIGDRA